MNMNEIISELGLEAKYESPQYKISLLFIRTKLNLKIPQTKMATLMELSLEQYLAMEKGSTKIRLTIYKEALRKLENYVRKHERLI